MGATEKEFENQKWLLKADVEGLITERVGKVAERARAAEAKLKELETAAEESAGKVAAHDVLVVEAAKLKADLAAASGRYETYTALAARGIADPDVVEGFATGHQRAMAGKAKKDHVAIGDWIDELVAEPDGAPALLRPHLPAAGGEADAGKGDGKGDGKGAANGDPKKGDGKGLPKGNAGVRGGGQPAATILDQVGKMDIDTYRKQREQVRAAWHQERGTSPPPPWASPTPPPKTG